MAVSRDGKMVAWQGGKVVVGEGGESMITARLGGT